jgi:hypothetical protein
MTVGILAFGSLVDNPGEELRPVLASRVSGVKTPFAIEFARSSRTRDGAPTLVPVDAGGARIEAAVLVLDGSISDEQARDMLYRRESGQVGGRATYRRSAAQWIGQIRDFAGVDICLYAALEPNIAPLTAAHLAELAIQSATAPSGRERRDGISYLREQERRGVETPLTRPYEAEILRRTGARDLDDAWARLQDATAAPGARTS